MLWTITIILFVLWAIGMVSGATLGWWIHILLVLAVISLIFAVMRRGAATMPAQPRAVSKSGRSGWKSRSGDPGSPRPRLRRYTSAGVPASGWQQSSMRRISSEWSGFGRDGRGVGAARSMQASRAASSKRRAYVSPVAW